MIRLLILGFVLSSTPAFSAVTYLRCDGTSESKSIQSGVAKQSKTPVYYILSVDETNNAVMSYNLNSGDFSSICDLGEGPCAIQFSPKQISAKIKPDIHPAPMRFFGLLIERMTGRIGIITMNYYEDEAGLFQGTCSVTAKPTFDSSKNRF